MTDDDAGGVKNGDFWMTSFLNKHSPVLLATGHPVCSSTQSLLKNIVVFKSILLNYIQNRTVLVDFGLVPVPVGLAGTRPVP